MTKFMSFMAGVQFSIIVFGAYMIHRIRKYSEDRQSEHAIADLAAKFMNARGHSGFGLVHNMHEKIESIMEDPQAHELKMACVDCQETWFPSSREEMAPCPSCGGMSVTGSA